MSTKPLTPAQQAVVDYLTKHGQLARSDVKSKQLDSRACDNLVSAGMATLTNGVYRLKRTERERLTGKVTDAVSGAAIYRATVDSGIEQVLSGKEGEFVVVIDKTTKVVKVSHPDFAPQAITNIFDADGKMPQADIGGVVQNAPRNVALRSKSAEAEEEARKVKGKADKAAAAAKEKQDKAAAREKTSKEKAENKEKDAEAKRLTTINDLVGKAETKIGKPFDDAKKAELQALPIAEVREQLSAAVKASKPSGSKKTSKEPHPCLCGCGENTKARFLPGHDAKLHSMVLKVSRKVEGWEQEIIDALPEATKEFVKHAPWATKSVLFKVGLGPDPNMVLPIVDLAVLQPSTDPVPPSAAPVEPTTEAPSQPDPS